MLLKKLYLLIAAYFPILLFAQQEVSNSKNVYQNEIKLVTENDNYTLQRRDGYYTNGFSLKLLHAVNPEKSNRFKNKSNIKKVINGFQIGQAIYNPVSYNRPFPELQDRPFAGYLAFTFDQHIFYKNNSLFEWAASLGTIGPNSGGKNVQRWYHNVIGIYDVKGWPYQVNNEMSINIKAAYYKTLLNQNVKVSQFNIDGFATAHLGNAFTDLSIGGTFKLGLAESLYNSSHHDAKVRATTTEIPAHNYELYFFYEPMVTLQAYNAVLQGGLFLKNKGPLTVPIKPVVLTQQVGVRFAQNRITTALIYINRTRQATTQQRNENFCSIQFGYRFGKVK